MVSNHAFTDPDPDKTMKVLGGLFGLIAVVALVAALLLEGPAPATAAAKPAATSAAH